MFDASMAVEIEHRVREQQHRLRLGDPEDAWFAEAMGNRGLAINRRSLGHAVRAIVLAVARIV